MQWVIPRDAGLTVKALSPDKTVMGEADGVYGPAGNSPLYVRGECKGPPRGLRPCRASHGDYAVTREIRQSAQKRSAPSEKSKERGRGRRLSEVGGTHRREEVDRREDEVMGEGESPYEVADELRDKQRLRERLREAKEKLLKKGSKEINLTDEEATTMLHMGYRADPSYNGQVTVEESHGVIVGATLSNNPADYEGLKELVEQTKESTGDKPSEVLGDSGFSSYENLEYLEEEKIEGYIADQGMESLRRGTCQNPEFHKSRFKYDGGEDCFICPMGRPLSFKGLQKRKGKPDLRMYRSLDCPGCARKLECTKADDKTLSLDPRESLMQKMRTRLESIEGRMKYRKRKWLVDPVFGDMKQNRNYRGLLLRGKRRAMGEFLIVCIAHNLRKIARYLTEAGNGPILQPVAT